MWKDWNEMMKKNVELGKLSSSILLFSLHFPFFPLSLTIQTLAISFLFFVHFLVLFLFVKSGWVTVIDFCEFPLVTPFSLWHSSWGYWLSSSLPLPFPFPLFYLSLHFTFNPSLPLSSVFKSKTISLFFISTLSHSLRFPSSPYFNLNFSPSFRHTLFRSFNSKHTSFGLA